jgi:hypothetical protein
MWRAGIREVPVECRDVANRIESIIINASLVHQISGQPVLSPFTALTT